MRELANLDCFGAFADPIVDANAVAQSDPNYYAPSSGVFTASNQVLPSLIGSTIASKQQSKNLQGSLKAAGKYVVQTGAGASKTKSVTGGLQGVTTTEVPQVGNGSVMPIILVAGGLVMVVGYFMLRNRS